MTAGHILIALCCKLPIIGFLVRGGILLVLETIVSVVQAYVFIILASVYLKERLEHC
jgi:F0F1-type ATP synthase membrane subunit a